MNEIIYEKGDMTIYLIHVNLVRAGNLGHKHISSLFFPEIKEEYKIYFTQGEDSHRLILPELRVICKVRKS